MLSQSKSKFIRSLQHTKYRTKESKFIVEGDKIVRECLDQAFSARFHLLEILALPDWLAANDDQIRKQDLATVTLTSRELQQLSTLKNPNQVIALMGFDNSGKRNLPLPDQYYLALDRIQDPGNLGTIFRSAEWFGISHIYLSEDTVDPLNPKVIQAGMGSVLRVSYDQTDLADLLSELSASIPVIGTVLDGERMDEMDHPGGGIILIGNESRGIQSELRQWITLPVNIPRRFSEKTYPESLNASVAASIVMSEFCRSHS